MKFYRGLRELISNSIKNVMFSNLCPDEFLCEYYQSLTLVTKRELEKHLLHWLWGPIFSAHFFAKVLPSFHSSHVPNHSIYLFSFLFPDTFKLNLSRINLLRSVHLLKVTVASVLLQISHFSGHSDEHLFSLTFYSNFLFQMKKKPPRLVLCLQVRMIPSPHPTHSTLLVTNSEVQERQNLLKKQFAEQNHQQKMLA